MGHEVGDARRVQVPDKLDRMGGVGWLQDHDVPGFDSKLRDFLVGLVHQPHYHLRAEIDRMKPEGISHPEGAPYRQAPGTGSRVTKRFEGAVS